MTALMGRLDVAYDTAVRGVSSAADRPGLTRAVADHDASGAAAVLRNVRELGFYRQVAVYDEAGALLASDPLGASPLAVESIPDAAVVLPPMPGPNGVGVTVRAPFHRDGRQLGQLVADVDFPQLVGGTEGLRLRGGVDVTIVDSNLVILSSALGPSAEGQKILAPEARALIQRGRPGTATYFAPRFGYDVVSTYLVAAGRPWGALAASKSDVVFAGANSLERRLLSGGFLIAGLPLAAAALVAAHVGAAERRLRRAHAVIAEHNESLATQAAELSETVNRLDAEVGARRQLIDTATDAFVSINATGVITEWNHASEAIFGWSRDEAVGAGMAELLIPEGYRDAHREGIRRFLSTGAGPILGKTLEMFALRRDDRQLPVELTIWATQTAAGWSFNSLMRDISERKALETVRARYEAVFKTSGDAIVLVDPSGTVLAWNPAAEAIYGYASEEMLGRNAASVIATPGQELARAEAVALLERGEQAPGEVHCLRKDGAEITVSVSRSSIVDDEGRVVAVSSISRDVTDRRRAEAQLRDSEERFRSLASNAPIGIFQTDAVGRCTYANPTWAAICGVKADVVPGRAWTSVVHPDEIGGTREAWRQALEDPAPFLHRFRAHRGDGEACWVDLRLVPVPSENGSPLEWVGTATDVTLMIEANVAIADARDRALKASQLKSQFLANMSHEIRTPMNGVVGTAELLSDSPLSNSQRTHVDALRAAANGLMAVLNDILDFSKIEAGKLALDPGSFHLPTLISDTVALFATTAQTKGIDLATNLAPGREWVRGDAARIRQVLANLLGNAVKFTERGQVLLIVEESARREIVRFTVVDSGIGIPDEVGARLMRPFEQGDPSTTRRFGGSGLGLAICHELVGLMGGSISFTSTPGTGTTFTVELPLPTAEPEDIKTPARSSRVLSSPATAGHVLVAEDVLVNQLVARGLLERLGWEVDVVGDGQAAVDAAARGTYDIVILDCQMPVLDGYDAARAIRLLTGRSGRAPIIAMTANALPEDRQRCLDSGMDDYLAKPITRDGLAEVLHRATQARPGSAD